MCLPSGIRSSESANPSKTAVDAHVITHWPTRFDTAATNASFEKPNAPKIDLRVAKPDAYVKINPTGLVPTLVLGDKIVRESVSFDTQKLT